MSQCRMPNTMGKKMEYPKFESAKNMSVAMAYVPWQNFGEVYEPDKALRIGTIFPELNKPFLGRSCGK